MNYYYNYINVLENIYCLSVNSRFRRVVDSGLETEISFVLLLPVSVWKQESLNVSAVSDSMPEHLGTGLSWLARANSG